MYFLKRKAVKYSVSQRIVTKLEKIKSTKKSLVTVTVTHPYLKSRGPLTAVPETIPEKHDGMDQLVADLGHITLAIKSSKRPLCTCLMGICSC